MDRWEYNLRLIVVFTVVILATIIGIFKLIKEGKKLKWFQQHFSFFRHAVIFAGIICIMLFLYFLFNSIAYKETAIQNVKVVEIVERGSFGGITDTFVIYLEDADGNVLEMTTMFTSSYKFRKSVWELEIEDVVNIKYAERVYNYLYFIEKIKE